MRLTGEEKKRRAAVLQAARLEIQRRLSRRVIQRVAPCPPPRYDDVFYDGTTALEHAARTPRSK